MASKVIIGILILLVVISGGLGYYAYTLSQQINFLTGQLTAFQMEQATQIDTLSSELSSFRGEALTNVGSLKEDIDENLGRIGTLQEGIDDNLTKIDSLENRTGETLAEVNALEEDIKNDIEDVKQEATELSQSIIDANEVYQKVSQATVRISNGDRTIGSGFILDNEGHVVTAHHVVEDLSKIYVVLPDGRISKATNTVSCLQSDLAVLTVEDELNVEPPKLADSSRVRTGEPVAAIGSPFDLAETLTTGIVSQTGRFIEIEYNSLTRWVPNLIQFDAAVNFGNSGGPLVNSNGEVIGLVIARIGPDEGDGIYYAVSSNKVKRVTDSLIAQGSFDYPWLGIMITNLTPQMAQDRGLESTNGILVDAVLSESPAAVVGIEADDIIVAIDGVDLRDMADLNSYLGEYKSPGETATITMIRNDSEMELSIEIGKRP
jgi:S1-C subfamily serine protease